MRVSLCFPVAEFAKFAKAEKGHGTHLEKKEVLPESEGTAESRKALAAVDRSLVLPFSTQWEEVVAYRSGVSTYQRNTGAENVGPADDLLVPVESETDRLSLERRKTWRPARTASLAC